jgi:hypothetical protein
MTEEEAIRQYMLQTDPFARATNDFGQGAGFLGLDSQPESWDRLGEKNDLYSDLFRMTRTYLPDYVDGLYPEAQDPGQFTGYRSDVADLYRNNPAYTQLDQLMAEGASFDEAVQLVADDPDYADVLPKNNFGQADLGGYRQSAEKYVSERAREGREFDTYDAERQAYEDYVRPRTGWDINPGVEDLSPHLRATDPVAVAAKFRPADSIGDMARDAQMVKRTPENASVVPPSIRQSIRDVGNPQARQATAANSRYNSGVQAAYEAARSKKEAVAAPSKKQENQAKLVRAYNLLMYGE